MVRTGGAAVPRRLLFLCSGPRGNLEKIDFVFITEAQVAADALRTIEPGSIIGLDTETYWSISSSRSKVSLVQLAAATGPVLVIDLLKVPVEIVRDVVENPSVMM